MEVDLEAVAPLGVTESDSQGLRPMAVDPEKESDLVRQHRTALSFLHTDAGAAQLFAHMLGGAVRYDHAHKRWLLWEQHRWRPDDDGNVNRLAVEIAKLVRDAAHDDALGLDADQRKAAFGWGLRLETRPRHDAMLAMAKNTEPIADSGQEWDTKPGLLGVPNGVVDLRTGELRDGERDDRITKHAGVAYDPEATCQRWEKFLREVFVDDETVAYIHKLVGATATAESALQLIAFLKGVGSNGKSLFLKMLSEALDEYAYDLPAGTLLAGSRNAHMHWIAGMEGARLVTCMELGDNEELNTDRLKHISGGDEVSADEKFKAGRKFAQTWIVWMTTNKQPRPTENTVAFWRRVRVVPTPNNFDPDAEPDLLDTLRGELPGILRWIVDGAVTFYAANRREGDRPRSVVEGTAEWREEVDRLAPILDSGFLVRTEANVWTPTTNLYAAYQAFAQQDNGSRVPLQYRMSEVSFGKRLAEQFLPSRRMVETGNGRKQFKGYHGVKAGIEAGEPLWRASWVVTDRGAVDPWPGP